MLSTAKAGEGVPCFEIGVYHLDATRGMWRRARSIRVAAGSPARALQRVARACEGEEAARSAGRDGSPRRG